MRVCPQNDRAERACGSGLRCLLPHLLTPEDDYTCAAVTSSPHTHSCGTGSMTARSLLQLRRLATREGRGVTNGRGVRIRQVASASPAGVSPEAASVLHQVVAATRPGARATPAAALRSPRASRRGITLTLAGQRRAVGSEPRRRERSATRRKRELAAVKLIV